ncbi:uncharacterized protein BDZ99DRAFT_522141 [Mytilinidion resinicola]|uniref:Uncharacterized protein n=1 Tax=Mytilinidion resinicola TaxID=574789 RepID=A0A6A6YKV5_9PEZI|nr:uncharacterized protein BDZ99DRAFT_522141 [Mytilinidion resinicola]KAF2808604.1 hypothetical protein BDZ99DRAFT_522141 [Mytilinidion resinicola]
MAVRAVLFPSSKALLARNGCMVLSRQMEGGRVDAGVRPGRSAVGGMEAAAYRDCYLVNCQAMQMRSRGGHGDVVWVCAAIVPWPGVASIVLRHTKTEHRGTEYGWGESAAGTRQELVATLNPPRRDRPVIWSMLSSGILRRVQGLKGLRGPF